MVTTLFVWVQIPEPQAEEPRDDRLELATLLDDCDQIAVGEVVQLLDVPRDFTYPENGLTVRVIELRVERVLWGDPATKTFAVLEPAPDRANLHVHGELQVGERAVWFVERWRFPWSKGLATRAGVAEIAGAAGMQVAASHGLGHLVLESDGEVTTVCVPAWRFRSPLALTLADTHRTANGADWQRFPRDDFEAWIQRELALRVPGLRAELWATGPLGQPFVAIGPDGRISADDDYNPKFAPPAGIGVAGLNAILELAREQRFFELPVALGHSPGPCSSSAVLRIRTELGAHWIRIDGPPSADEQGAYARLKKLWNAIPVARNWKIDRR